MFRFASFPITISINDFNLPASSAVSSISAGSDISTVALLSLKSNRVLNSFLA